MLKSSVNMDDIEVAPGSLEGGESHEEERKVEMVADDDVDMVDAPTFTNMGKPALRNEENALAYWNEAFDKVNPNNMVQYHSDVLLTY